jgi:hypothetical protein
MEKLRINRCQVGNWNISKIASEKFLVHATNGKLRSVLCKLEGEDRIFHLILAYKVLEEGNCREIGQSHAQDSVGREICRVEAVTVECSGAKRLIPRL